MNPKGKSMRRIQHQIENLGRANSELARILATAPERDYDIILIEKKEEEGVWYWFITIQE
jgi:hypothetical protein